MNCYCSHKICLYTWYHMYISKKQGSRLLLPLLLTVTQHKLLWFVSVCMCASVWITFVAQLCNSVTNVSKTYLTLPPHIPSFCGHITESRLYLLNKNGFWMLCLYFLNCVTLQNLITYSLHNTVISEYWSCLYYFQRNSSHGYYWKRLDGVLQWLWFKQSHREEGMY